jgi:ubiquitin-activating enzyme E1
LGVTSDEQARRRDATFVRELLGQVELAPWKPKDNVKIQVDPSAGPPPPEETDAEALASTLAALPPPNALVDVAFGPQEFEKDDATNFHMDFIHAVANLRAENYLIAPVDKLQAKLIAGTSVVS